MEKRKVLDLSDFSVCCNSSLHAKKRTDVLTVSKAPLVLVVGQIEGETSSLLMMMNYMAMSSTHKI